MKTNINKHISLGAGLLTVGAALSIAGTVSAAPAAVRRERKDVQEARKDVRQEQKDLRKADTAREYQRERRQLEAAKKDLRQEQRDLSRARGNTPARRPYVAPRSTWNNRPVRRPVYNNRGRAQNVDFYGTVLENTTTSRAFRVRARNGGIMTVSYSRESFRAGQQVKVVGYRQNGLVVATDINRV